MKHHDQFNTAMEEAKAAFDEKDVMEEVQPGQEAGAEESLEATAETEAEAVLLPNPTIVVKKDGEVVFEYSIEDLPVQIGRKSDNHIVLDERNVSRKHARILKKDDQFFIEDLESTGGTQVNGEPVKEKDIHTGDLIQIGSYQLLFNSGIPEDERTIYDAEESTVLEEGTEMDEDRTLFYEEPVAKLVVVKSEALEGEILLEEEETVIGRDADAGIPIEDKRISRKHCRIWLDGDAYKITDLGSSNGTFVNGKKVTEQALENGDTLQIGSSTFSFRVERTQVPAPKNYRQLMLKGVAALLILASVGYAAYRLIPRTGPKRPQKVILQTLWERPVAAAPSGSASLGDLNGDGFIDLVSADVSGSVLALDARQGGMIWNSEYRTNGGRLTGSALLADINHFDGRLDVVMPTSTNGVLAIDGSTMILIWKGNTGAPVSGTPQAADINSDGVDDVFLGTRSGAVICFDGKQGGIIWEEHLGAPLLTSPVVGDMNRDGKADVVIGANNYKIYAFDGTNGHIIWVHVGTNYPSTAALSDMNKDGIPDVTLMTPDEVVVLEGQKGAALWRWQIPITARPSARDPFRPLQPAVSDLNGDRVPDVVVSTSGGHVYAIDGASGGKDYIWDYGLTPSPKTSPALSDLSLDGIMDVVVGDREGHVIVIDGMTGHRLNYIDAGGAIEFAPVVADFNANGTLDIAGGTQNKKIVVIETETPVKKNQIAWNSF